MLNFEIKTYYDQNHEDLIAFRENVFLDDLNLSLDLLYIDIDYINLQKIVQKDLLEDAYKYGNHKWNRTKFDRIECIIDNDKIVGISGARAYGKNLRISMFFYLLKKYRSKYPGIKYLPNGYFQRQLEFASLHDMEFLFFTVYPYNKKLYGLIQNHTKRCISLVPKNKLKFIQDVKMYPKPTLFNGVEQYFFYYPLRQKIEFSPELVIPYS